MTHRGIVRTPGDIIDRKVFARSAHCQHRSLVLQMIQIERPVRAAGEKHARPALTELDPIDGTFVTLVGLQVLLVVRDRAAVQGAVLSAGDICGGVSGVEVQGQTSRGVTDPAFALNERIFGKAIKLF